MGDLQPNPKKRKVDQIEALQEKLGQDEKELKAAQNKVDEARKKLEEEEAKKTANERTKLIAQNSLISAQKGLDNAQKFYNNTETMLKYWLAQPDQPAAEAGPSSANVEAAWLTSFFKALRDTEPTKVDDLEVVELQIHPSWDLDRLQLGVPEGVEKLYFLMREEYKRLKEAIGDSKHRAAIVLGTSGIGKSAFRFYLIRCWLQQDKWFPHTRFHKVVFNFASDFYQMDSEGIVLRLGSISSLADLDRNSLALLDPCTEVAAIQKNIYFKLMVVTTSPSPVSGQSGKPNLSELQKADHVPTFVMKMWQEEETKAVFPGMSDEMCQAFGCVPRWCKYVSPNDPSLRSKLLRECLQDKLKAILEFFKSQGHSRLYAHSDLPYRLFEIDMDESGWGAKTFISKYVAKVFLDLVKPLIHAEDAAIAKVMKDPFSMQGFGYMFEEWAFKELAKGTEFELSPGKKVLGKFSTVSSFLRSDVKTQKAAAAKFAVGTIYKAPRGYGSIDALGITESVDGSRQLLLFQETVGKQHEPAQWEHVETIFKAVKSKSTKPFECVVVYLVPSDSWDAFKPPKLPEDFDKNICSVKGRLTTEMPDALGGLQTWEEALKKK